MKLRTPTSAVTCIMLVTTCGIVAHAHSQWDDKPKNVAALVSTTFDFRSSKWMSERAVVNNNGEEIAKVSDLILERGTGRIEYAVIKTGTTLGLGGRAIAVPYAAFKWEAAGGTDRFILSHTAEQLKQFAEYTPENWKALKEVAPNDRSELRQKLESGSASGSDPYAGNLEVAKRQSVSGEIKNVERVQTTTFGEQVQISVETSDGTRNVTLGPSWYVNSSPAAPMRGDKIVVETLTLARDTDNLLAATHARIGGNELHLRDGDGSPAWTLVKTETSGQAYSMPYSRYLLLSELIGVKIDCRGNECGKVFDVIIERTSGAIGFISIDPNQNFLGISDTKRMVPWSIAYVLMNGTMRIDASKEMVLASPETPGDLARLNTGVDGDRVYKAFKVPAPRYDLLRHDSQMKSESSGAWSSRGPIIAAIDHKSAVTIEGEVTGTSEVKFENGAGSGRALNVRTMGASGADEVVLLGPAWYMDHQKTMYKTGDSVKVEVCKTTIDGRKYWLARSVTSQDKKVVILDGKDIPVWAQP